MNAVATTDPRRALAPAQRPSRQQTIAKTLRTVHDTHLSIWTDYHRMMADFAEARRGDNWRGSFLQLPRHRHFQPDSEAQRENSISYLMEHVDRQPSLQVAGPLLDRVNAAYQQGFNEPQVRVIIGLMIDAFPNARPHSPEAYMETLVHELSVQGALTAAIAKGCNDVTLSSKFLPAVSEVLERVTKSASALDHICRTFRRYSAWSATTKDAVVWLKSMPLWDRADGADRLEFEGNDPF